MCRPISSTLAPPSSCFELFVGGYDVNIAFVKAITGVWSLDDESPYVDNELKGKNATNTTALPTSSSSSSHPIKRANTQNSITTSLTTTPYSTRKVIDKLQDTPSKQPDCNYDTDPLPNKIALTPITNSNKH